ncbi:hypothetical protein [Rivularia sp. PCC 7116]|uniref:hypothetical protein n=1 Tax=Rivularia sp. PCC 7116 TaxID=373994 RepID=UPI00030C8395|nr:hypothetical protein [Rivularia sp. PCC 7116]
MLSPQPKVFAQTNSNSCEAGIYELINVADTQTIRPTDILSTEVEQIGIGNESTSLETDGAPYRDSSNPISEPRYWEMRVSNSDLPINTSDVKYTLQSNSQQNNPFQENRVELQVLDIEEIERCPDNNTTVISGGISLIFRELEQLVPGNFRGDINVCVSVNGNQCQ